MFGKRIGTWECVGEEEQGAGKRDGYGGENRCIEEAMVWLGSRTAGKIYMRMLKGGEG